MSGLSETGYRSDRPRRDRLQGCVSPGDFAQKQFSVQGGGAGLQDTGAVLGCAVAAVSRPAVARMAEVGFLHPSVATGFGEDGGEGDAERGAVTADQPVVGVFQSFERGAVDEDRRVGGRCGLLRVGGRRDPFGERQIQAFERARHRQHGGPEDVVGFDLSDIRLADREEEMPAGGASAHEGLRQAALVGRELLRVVDPGGLQAPEGRVEKPRGQENGGGEDRSGEAAATGFVHSDDPGSVSEAAPVEMPEILVHSGLTRRFRERFLIRFLYSKTSAMNALISEITQEQLRTDRANFKVGDGVKVHTRVREGEKTRIQIFAGIVIARKGSGIHETFTVRRIASGVGVERVFPVHSPNIEKVEVDRESVVMRARMYYMRERIGKRASLVKEKRLVEQGK